MRNELRFAHVYAFVIHMAALVTPTSVLSVRLNAGERALLEAAAEQSHTNVSDFVRRKAIEAAEADVLSRSIVTIPAKDWARFEAWASRPGRPVKGLAELDRVTPTWAR